MSGAPSPPSPGDPLDDGRSSIGWRVAGAAVTGSSHERAGRGCDDAWAVARGRGLGGPVAAVCVCDGAGSAARGADGARLASRVAAKYLARRFDLLHAANPGAIGADLIGRVRRAIRRAARGGREKEFKEFAATLIAVAADGCGRSLVAHLGDGAVLGRRGDGPVGAVSLPDNGEFANVTYFVTDEDAASRVRVSRFPRPGAPAPPPPPRPRSCCSPTACKESYWGGGSRRRPPSPRATFRGGCGITRRRLWNRRCGTPWSMNSNRTPATI